MESNEILVESCRDRITSSAVLASRLAEAHKRRRKVVDAATVDRYEAQFSAFVKSHALGAAQVDGAVGFSAVLRLSGGVTVT